MGRQVMPGVFNLDREEMLRSFRKLADVDAELACVGHGEPIKNAHIALPATAGLIP
ncbi:hypothetical protein ACGFNP_38095 [Nonomuraea sp. NPDC049269]|uniref:hypothetical protein n=1 Tax=Nonomuraea sp. NPDC049269 TaxID=3364349 RepID=UPI0037121FBF